jgi:hypothetical protein
MGLPTERVVTEDDTCRRTIGDAANGKIIGLLSA